MSALGKAADRLSRRGSGFGSVAHRYAQDGCGHQCIRTNRRRFAAIGLKSSGIVTIPLAFRSAIRSLTRAATSLIAGCSSCPKASRAKSGWLGRASRAATSTGRIHR